MPTAATYRYKNTQFSLSPATLHHILLKGLSTARFNTPVDAAGASGIQCRQCLPQKQATMAENDDFSAIITC